MGDDDYNKTGMNGWFIPVDMRRSIADKLRRLLDSIFQFSERHSLQTFSESLGSDGCKAVFVM
jgi:hypothetical protein